MNNQPIPQQIGRMDSDRLRAYRENLEFYSGTQWLGPNRRRERRLTFNYARTFIDKATSFLCGSLNFTVDPVDSSPQAIERARHAEQALYSVYHANNLEQLDFDTELDTAILGDGCYKVTWDPAEERIRISAPDVQGLFAWWIGDDTTRVWRVASRYQLTLDEAEMLYGVKNTGPAYRRGDVTMVEAWTARELELWLDDKLLERRVNPYGFIPLVIFPNIREPQKFWGVSDMPPIMEPARELNRALSQLSMILELSGNPIAVLENVTDAQDIAVQPGAVWELPERARAYLLDLLQGGGVKLHTDYVDMIYRTLHDLAETPRTAFGENRQGLSGVALEMELNPLLQKVRRKRLLRAVAYKQRAEMILRILEQKTGEKYLPCRVRIVWGAVLPQDRGRVVRDEEILVRAGIHSRRTAMEALGVEDPEGELARLKGEGLADSKTVVGTGNEEQVKEAAEIPRQ